MKPAIAPTPRRLPSTAAGALAARLVALEPFRFACVGVWNMVFSVICYAAIHRLLLGGRHYMLAAVIATILSVTNSFLFHRWFTFRSRTPVLSAYLRFYVVYGVQIGLNFLLLPLCVEWLHFEPTFSQASVVLATTALTYVGHRRFSFRMTPTDN